MAKDGTCRGGVRIGAGKKKKALSEKILEGNFNFQSTPENSTFEIPAPKEYITAVQSEGVELHSKEIYEKTYEWLKERGCAEVVLPQLVESYSQVIGRHIQCEELLSRDGFTSHHPTTGSPTASYFVKMSLDYLKSAQQLWYQIFQIVKENSLQGVGDSANDAMENILRMAK